MATDRSFLTIIGLPFIPLLCSVRTQEDLLILHFPLTRGVWHQIDVTKATDLTASVCDEMSLCCQFLVVSIASVKAGSQPISQFTAMLDSQPQYGWIKANEGSMFSEVC